MYRPSVGGAVIWMAVGPHWKSSPYPTCELMTDHELLPVCCSPRAKSMYSFQNRSSKLVGGKLLLLIEVGIELYSSTWPACRRGGNGLGPVFLIQFRIA